MRLLILKPIETVGAENFVVGKGVTFTSRQAIERQRNFHLIMRPKSDSRNQRLIEVVVVFITP